MRRTNLGLIKLAVLTAFLTLGACLEDSNNNASKDSKDDSQKNCISYDEQIFFPSQLKPGSNWSTPDPDFTWNVFSINPLTGNLKPITNYTQGKINRIVRVSGSGKYINFYSTSNLSGKDTDPATAAANLWVLTRDLKNFYPITKNTLSLYDTVSGHITPDDSKIVFDSVTDLSGAWDGTMSSSINLWTANIDGSNRIPLTLNTKTDLRTTTAAMSPDGKFVVAHSFNDLTGVWDGTPTASANLWYLSLDGKIKYPLTKNTKKNIPTPIATVFPDARKIAFISKTDPTGTWDGTPSVPHNIWTINSDGTNLKRITNYSKADISSIRVSPDGQKMVFHSTMALDGTDIYTSVWNVWIMNIDGTGLMPLTKNTILGYDSVTPTFSPSGKYVSFFSKSDINGSWNGIKALSYNLWIINTDGNGLTALTKNSHSSMDTNGSSQYAWAKAITCNKK